MTAANGRAAVRRAQNNTPTLGGGTATDTLAKLIGEAVALHLAPLIGQLAQALAAQKTACVYCAARAKMAGHAHAKAVEALRAEQEIAAKAAAELGGAPPELTLPEFAPPGIQEAFTWVPVVIAPGQPPTSVPVCFDCLPEEPQTAPAGPRATGLVTGDGRPVVAAG